MNVLLLGGIGEAATIARDLHTAGHAVTYSLAGRAGAPELPCPVRRGGFGGAAGLARYLAEHDIDWLVDATHPHAARISANAAAAAAETGRPLWRYDRPAEEPGAGDDWRFVADWRGARAALAGFRRPLVTLGRAPLADPDPVPPGQHWLVRCLPGTEAPARAGCTVLRGRGPFTEAEERALMKRHGVDVVVAKHGSAPAVTAKLAAARALGLPVILLERPPLPPATRSFHDPLALARALRAGDTGT